MRIIATFAAFIVTWAVMRTNHFWLDYGGGDVSTALPASFLVAIAVFFVWKVVDSFRANEPLGKTELAKIAVISSICVLLTVGCVACSEQSEWLTEAANKSASLDDDYNDRNSSLSKDEQGRRAAEEEASHYYYDKNGHLRDDRD